MTEQPEYYTRADLEAIVRRELAAAQGGRRKGSIGTFVATLLWWGFLLVMAGAFILLTADHFKMIPQPLIDKVLPAPQVTFSTPVGAPGAAPVVQERMTQFYRPTEVPVFSGALQPSATAEPTATSEPYTTQPNLGPSSPDDNPGFTCGVEPGMAPDATCEETRPDAISSASIPKTGPRRVKEKASDKVGPGEQK